MINLYLFENDIKYILNFGRVRKKKIDVANKKMNFIGQYHTRIEEKT